FARDSIAGVYIHATAVNNLVRDEGLLELGRVRTMIAAFGLAAITAISALVFGPVLAASATIGIAVIWIAGATLAFRHALVLPLVEPLIAAVAALGATIGYRFVIVDRGKRLLRQSFALYLAPAVIERMLSSNKPPTLGGEMRNVSVYFSDIADFTTMSEKIAPAGLVAAMNEYLSTKPPCASIASVIAERYSFIAATSAVRAALRCSELLGTLDRVNAAFGAKVRQRIGI